MTEVQKLTLSASVSLCGFAGGLMWCHFGFDLGKLHVPHVGLDVSDPKVEPEVRRRAEVAGKSESQIDVESVLVNHQIPQAKGFNLQCFCQYRQRNSKRLKVVVDQSPPRRFRIAMHRHSLNPSFPTFKRQNRRLLNKNQVIASHNEIVAGCDPP